ncbi:MAG: histone deacetylase [Treponema sp.]|jgi:acetoin utilization deacetylase AcuC-like enzyme|nr:histone deacetylase [Treponema sp.]
MILHDPSLNAVFRDYGIMLPIAPDRPSRILEHLTRTASSGAGKDILSAFPGPVLDTAGAQMALGLPPGPAVNRHDLERVHQKEFIAGLYGDGPEDGGPVKALLNAYELIDAEGRPRRYEPERAVKPLSALFKTILAQVGGTYLACRLALTDQALTAGGPGFCYYLGGGMHHARYDSGAGFCLINDIVTAARRLQAEGRARLIWIIDVDVHKGDGTAELIRFARKRGELGVAGLPEQAGKAAAAAEILNLSIHMARGWPLDPETMEQSRPDRAPRIPADVEIPIEAGEEDRYIPALRQGFGRLESLSAAWAANTGGCDTAINGIGCGGGGHFPRPDLAIVVDGADPYEHDGLPSGGLLKLTLEQCLERDRLIYSFLQARGIPSAWIMAGGYGERAWEPAAEFLSALASR